MGTQILEHRQEPDLYLIYYGQILEANSIRELVIGPQKTVLLLFEAENGRCIGFKLQR